MHPYNLCIDLIEISKLIVEHLFSVCYSAYRHNVLDEHTRTRRQTSSTPSMEVTRSSAAPATTSDRPASAATPPQGCLPGQRSPRSCTCKCDLGRRPVTSRSTRRHPCPTAPRWGQRPMETSALVGDHESQRGCVCPRGLSLS
jgi:hypothetical protein